MRGIFSYGIPIFSTRFLISLYIHICLQQLRDTIVAELVRYWFPDLRHNSQFQQMKKSLLKGKIPFKDFRIEATLKKSIEQSDDELIQKEPTRS